MRFVLKTWNCFGAAQSVGSFLRWRGAADAHRFEHPALREAVESADLLCVQELWLEDAVQFFEGLGHGHKTRDDNRSTLFPLTFGGSGLGIASRFPVVERRAVPFSRPHVGSERFARKGVLHARVDLGGGLELDVITTHLQSGYTEGARAVRERQVTEIRRLVDEVGSTERAFVVCGDLNIDGHRASRGEGEYTRLAQVLADFHDLGAEDDHTTYHPHPEANALAHRFEPDSPRQRIDYVFFRAPSCRTLRAAACELALHEPLPDLGDEQRPTWASDHFGVRVVLELSAAGELAS